MDIKHVSYDRIQTSNIGLVDVVQNGELVSDVQQKSVLVTAQTDLAQLPQYPAGTMAYTAGFKKMWMLAANGQWVEL